MPIRLLATTRSQLVSDRAEKYDTAQLDEMLKKGEAFKNENGEPSFPIADAEDLEDAIRAVGRAGADHDAVRKYIIGRADALGMKDKIPENWNADGSLAADENSARVADLHARVGAMSDDDATTYADMRDLLQQAIAAKYNDPADDWDWVYVYDFTDTWVVFEKDCETFQVDYTIEGNTVTLGESVPVRTVTSYVPIETKSAPTKQDPKVMAALLAVKAALTDAKAAQAKDPDKTDDPDDVAVSTQLGVIEQALTHALAAQAADGNDDTEKKSSNRVPAIPKRAFASLTERPVPALAHIRVGEMTDAAAGVPFTGYASTTGEGYAVRDWLGEYTETIAPGAFAKTLREQSAVPLLQNHDANLVLANTSSKTSTLAEDANGLRNDASINPEFRALITSMRRGDVNKMSFSFRAIKDTWNDDYDNRAVNELALYDTSIVTYPCNPSTSAELLDEFRSVLGREGVALAWSVRSAIGGAHGGRVDSAAEPLIESVIRALGVSDETLSRRSDSYALQGRARTFAVASLMEQLRVGKPISAANLKLVTSAMDAISSAAAAHEQLAAAHVAATEALSTLSGSTGPKPGSSADEATQDSGETSNPADTGDGLMAGDTSPGGNGAGSDQNTDGLGVRKVPAAVLRAQRDLEILKLRSK